MTSFIVIGPKLKQFQCIKKVHAAKILQITIFDEYTTLDLEGSRYVDVTNGWMIKHEPQKGGYYVVYPDKYISYSTAEAFKSDYIEIQEETKTNDELVITRIGKNYDKITLGKIDTIGEMEVELQNRNFDHNNMCSWIDKDEAKRIVDHLTQQFEL